MRILLNDPRTVTIFVFSNFNSQPYMGTWKKHVLSFWNWMSLQGHGPNMAAWFTCECDSSDRSVVGIFSRLWRNVLKNFALCFAVKEKFYWYFGDHIFPSLPVGTYLKKLISNPEVKSYEGYKREPGLQYAWMLTKEMLRFQKVLHHPRLSHLK